MRCIKARAKRPLAPKARSGRMTTWLVGWAPQVTAAMVLSVGVRWQPTVTPVNGRLVARPLRTTHTRGVFGSHGDPRVRHDAKPTPRSRRNRRISESTESTVGRRLAARVAPLLGATGHRLSIPPAEYAPYARGY